MSIPEGSCRGSGGSPSAGSEEQDRRGRATGLCPACFGRFRLLAGTIVPNHSPTPAVKREQSGRPAQE